MKSRSAFGVVLVSTMLSACEADQPLPVPRLEPGSVHLMPVDAESAADQQDLATDASPPRLQYYGGPVIPAADVVVVFWGRGEDAAVESGLPGFYSAVLDSPYLDWLGEYDTDIPGGTGQKIVRGRFRGSVTIEPSHDAAVVDDREIQKELGAQITAGILPAPDANTLYMTYFPPGITVTEEGSSSCAEFCAYHGTFRRGGKPVFYGVVPDMGPGSGCDSGCGVGTPFQNVTSVSSHELVEAITDPAVGLATSVGKPIAWYDPRQGEIGDLCNAKPGTIAGYTVQKQWDNASSSCIVSKGGDVSDFSIALSPASRTIAPGASAALAVKVAIVSGATEAVTLSVTGLPPGVTASLSPDPVASGSAAALTLAVSAAAAPGTWPFTVKGTAPSGTRSSSGSLIVSGDSRVELVVNGGFEGSLAGWTPGGSKIPIDSTAESHGGSYAMRLGATTSVEPDGDSSAVQTITVPAGHAATLTFWFYAKSDDVIANDWQEAAIRDETGAPLKTIFHEASNARVWTKETVDLTPYAGRTIQLRFDVHEDGAGTPTSLWIDDVSATGG